MNSKIILNRILSILLIFICFDLCAQNNLDSLYGIWQDKNQSDSIRVKAYKDYIWKGFLFSDSDSAIILSEELIKFSQEKKYPKAQAIAYNIQGISFYNKDNYPKALKFYMHSLKIMEAIGDKMGIASLQNRIGNVYHILGNHSQDLNYSQRSLKIYEEIEYKDGIALSLNNIGNIYSSQSNNLKALEYYRQSLKIWKEIENKNGIALSLLNMGNNYKEQGNYQKALVHSMRSLKMLEEIGDKQSIASIISNIGNIFKDQGDYLKALEYYQQSLKINEEIGNKQGIAYTRSNIGEIYQKQGDYQKALKFCGKALSISEDIGSLEGEKEACRCLYDTYKDMSKGDEALVYIEKIQVINDSLHSQETSKNLQQMEFAKQVFADSLATAKKERLVEEAHEEEVQKKNRTRNGLLIGGGFLFLLAGGIYSRLRYVRKSKANLQIEKDRSENLLLNILPADIAEELKLKGRADARDFDTVSILFTDFKGFTQTSEKLTAKELVGEINACFVAFDSIIEKYKVEKIKTIGDSYMAAGGLPIPTDDSVKNTVLAALEMQAFITKRKAENEAQNKPAFEMRVGIHTGPVVAGIVGVKKFQYDIWGDTVNTASRMESSGEVGKVNISQSTYEIIEDEFECVSRGKIEAKGKGEIDMYFVEGLK